MVRNINKGYINILLFYKSRIPSKRQFVRVVKETDLKSVGTLPHRFKSCSCRNAFGVVVTYVPTKDVPGVRFPGGVKFFLYVKYINAFQKKTTKSTRKRS